MKGEQCARKTSEGSRQAFVQDDGDSWSSSDEEELDRRVGGLADEDEEGGEGKGKRKEKGKGGEDPKKGLKGWIKGDRERVQRETEGDEAGRVQPSAA